MRFRTSLFLIAINLATMAAAAELEPEKIRAAVAKSLPLLEKGATGHREQRACFSCHNQGVPILALATAKERGLAINQEELDRQLAFIHNFLKQNREKFLAGKGTGGEVDTAGYALLALNAGAWKPDDTTAAVVEYLLLFQRDADHWKNSSHRPPSEASEFTTTYLGYRALQQYGLPEHQERIAARKEKIVAWIATAKPQDTEDRVFQLRLLAALERPAEEITSASRALGELQRDDGGWSQLAEQDSDAYATGTVLVALHQAGGLATSDPAYQRGLKFLLEQQQDDGSWHVVSRSKPFQKYFETGFPHDKDQFISAAASGWATLALTLALEKPESAE